MTGHAGLNALFAKNLSYSIASPSISTPRVSQDNMLNGWFFLEKIFQFHKIAGDHWPGHDEGLSMSLKLHSKYSR